ncbi:DUF2605 domain-containing protein [Cyanobacterium stanieri LEGE 03274]|uniref:DUF2605 domain-containing protein n=1 Tax=Cyanobacterium stanieri LEGE 03274 TaxID=1828756 RepID=A0ABR9V151_9CHRO|nr:DUF2605 domain-containing protein [Cyanobacterium stanieri]MBE9221281.1 DUF2605 domain-containing protein [Cyanobacterium stanieri LEGE 03274]
MQPSQPTEKELLAKVLAPLLEDFQYWFSRSITLLESERITFLSEQEQNDLIARIKSSQDEVKTASMLFRATDGQAGVDTKVLMPWHSLVAECWGVARRWRLEKEQNPN